MEVFDANNRQAGWQPTHEELSAWLREQVIGVFSTLDETGAPESATVAFSQTQSGDFVIGASDSSHKMRNVMHDERIALTVTNETERYTAQIKGVAQKMSEDAFNALAGEHYRQRPESLPFKDEPGQGHILVTPHSIRFSDCSVQPWLTTEFRGSNARRDEAQESGRNIQ